MLIVLAVLVLFGVVCFGAGAVYGSRHTAAVAAAVTKAQAAAAEVKKV